MTLYLLLLNFLILNLLPEGLGLPYFPRNSQTYLPLFRLQEFGFLNSQLKLAVNSFSLRNYHSKSLVKTQNLRSKCLIRFMIVSHPSSGATLAYSKVRAINFPLFRPNLFVRSLCTSHFQCFDFHFSLKFHIQLTNFHYRHYLCLPSAFTLYLKFLPIQYSGLLKFALNSSFSC